jgi:ABC-type spermidine/putrescine transport system permease subunit I
MKLESGWAEIFALFFLLGGFYLSVLLHNPIYSYITIFLSGFIAARFFYFRRYAEPIFPFVLIIAGFLLGYLIGSIWVSRLFVLVFFVLGYGLSYYLHQKKILGKFKSELFVK